MSKVVLRNSYYNAARRRMEFKTDFRKIVEKEHAAYSGQTPEKSGGGFGKVLLYQDTVFKGVSLTYLSPYLEQEEFFMRCVGGKGLAMPSVKLAGWDAFYFGMTRLPGRTVKTADLNDPRLLREITEGVAHFSQDLDRVLPPADAARMIRLRYGVRSTPDSMKRRMGEPQASGIFGALTQKFRTAVDEHADSVGAQSGITMHADIKRDNIMTDNGFAGIIDFGLLNIQPPAALYAWIFKDHPSLLPAFTDAWNGMDSRRVTPREAGLHAAITHIDWRLTKWNTKENSAFVQEAASLLNKVDSLYPAPVQAAVPGP